MDYFTERNQKNILRLRELIAELPEFCSQFFLAISNSTSPLTRINYAYDLRIFFEFLSKSKFMGLKFQSFTLSHLEKVTANNIEQFLDYLTLYRGNGRIHENNEKAKSRALSAVRSMLKYFYKLDLLSCDVGVKVATPKLHDKAIILLEPQEIANLLDETEFGHNLSPHQQAFHEKQKLRDMAILTLFLGTGIRISELIGLDINDLDFDNNAFKVTRKGGNQVVLYFGQEVHNALLAYLDERKSNADNSKNSDLHKATKRNSDIHTNSKATTDTKCQINQTNENPALFLSNRNCRISIRAVENLVKKYARLTTPLKNISPHKLRSTYGTALYRETHDIYIVAEVLGHRDVNTTKKHYANISDDIRRSVANKVVLRDDETISPTEK